MTQKTVGTTIMLIVFDLGFHIIVSWFSLLCPAQLWVGERKYVRHWMLSIVIVVCLNVALCFCRFKTFFADMDDVVVGLD